MSADPAYKYEDNPEEPGHAEIWRLRRVSSWPEFGAAAPVEYEWFAECALEDAEFICAALNAAHKRHEESEIG